MKTKFKGVKTAVEYQRGALAKDALRLIGAGVVLGASVVAPNLGQVIDYFNPKGAAERRRIWRAIKYLESKGYVDIEEQGSSQYVSLTKHGRIRLDAQTIDELMVESPTYWDHKWRLVMFDVPAQRGNVRNEFRRKLEDLGFVMYQRSVFIFPHECHEEVFTVAQWYGIKKHIRYIVATEINDMRRFIREFDLL